jgi:hypothetical protein
MGLFDIVRVARAELPKLAAGESVPVSKVNGLVCEKCGMFYARPPLVGTCKCGGALLFSSEAGPAKVAVLV